MSTIHLLVLILCPGFVLSWSNPFIEGDKTKEILACESDQSWNKTPIPKSPECQELHSPNRTLPSPIAYTIYKEQTNINKIPLFYCKTVVLKSSCYVNLFGALYTHKQTVKTTTSRLECQILQDKHRLNMSTSITIGTLQEAECSWMTTSELESRQVTLSRSYGIYSREHETISHGFSMGHRCLANSGECSGDSQIIYWDHASIPSRCIYYPYMDSVATVSWNAQYKNIFIVDASKNLMFSLSTLQYIVADGCFIENDQLLMTDEGVPVLFHHDKSISFSELIKVNTEAWTILTHKNHINRSQGLTGLSPSLDVPRINAALFDLQKTSSLILQSIENKVCMLNFFSWESAWGLRHLSPISSVKIFLKRQDIIGYLSGSYIYFSICRPTFSWVLETEGQCGDSWKTKVPKGLCLDGQTMIATLCPSSCPPGDSSFSLQINKTHQLNLNQSPLLPIPLSHFYNPLSLSTNIIKIEGTPLYSLGELSSSLNVMKALDSLKTNINDISKSITGTDIMDKTGHSFVGSPSLYTSLGFVAGKVTSLGSWIWGISGLSVLIIWCVIIRAAFIVLYPILKKRKSRTAQSQVESETACIERDDSSITPSLHLVRLLQSSQRRGRTATSYV